MIQIPWIAGLATDKLVKIAFGLGFALCFFLIGMGVHKSFSDRRIAVMQKDFAVKEAQAATALANAERSARETERTWQEAASALEAKYLAALDKRNRVVRDLRIIGDGLRNRLDGLIAASSAAATTSPTCRDVHKRVEVVGVLLREADGLAEESGLAADAVGEELRLCRAYVEAVTKQD